MAEKNNTLITINYWTSSTGARAWASDCQGVKASRPQVFAQKDTRTGNKLQKTPRDGAENGEVEAEAQGTGGRRIQRH